MIFKISNHKSYRGKHHISHIIYTANSKETPTYKRLKRRSQKKNEENEIP